MRSTRVLLAIAITLPLVSAFAFVPIFRAVQSWGRPTGSLEGIDLPALGYECVRHVAGVRATHVFLRKRG